MADTTQGTAPANSTPSPDDLVEVRLILTREALGALQSALDLHGRIAMGQWGEVARYAPEVLPADQCVPFSPAADAIMEVRCTYASHEALRNSHAASMGIASAGRDARIVCDLWRAVGGGMPGRSDHRLTDTVKAATVRALDETVVDRPDILEPLHDDAEVEDATMEMTEDELREAMRHALHWAGIAFEDLEAQAAAGVFESELAEVIWFRISDFVDEGIRP